jgi:hypothetical protein
VSVARNSDCDLRTRQHAETAWTETCVTTQQGGVNDRSGATRRSALHLVRGIVLSSLSQRGLAIMSETFDKARDAAEEAVRRTEETAQDVAKRAGRAAGKARDRAYDMMGAVDLRAARAEAERRARANPILGLLVAGALGIVIGRFLTGRRR